MKKQYHLYGRSMNKMVFAMIFLMCLFVYTHIRYHIKQVNELDIYDMGQITKDKLEEVCRLKQPVTFIMQESKIENTFCLSNMIQEYPEKPMKLYHLENTPVFVPLKDVTRLVKHKDYTSFNNVDLVDNPSILNQLQLIDSYLSPPLTIYQTYDLWVGGSNAIIPKQQHHYYRQYLYITNGFIECSITTPDGNKQQSIIVNQSEVLYIPPYWTYEITFKKSAFICVYRYDTIFSIISRLPTLCMNYIDKKHEIQYSLKTKPLDNKLKNNTLKIEKENVVSSTDGKDEGGQDASNTITGLPKKKRKSKTTIK